MLPSVSAELPAYLVPPTGRGGGTGPPVEAGAEPTVDRVELSVDRAVDAQSRSPNSGLYGPDGRFVDASPRASEEGARRNASDSGAREDARNLTLDEIDAVVPPAAREELRALADRVEKKPPAKPLTSEEYRRISDLMERVGRHSEATAARARAEELEQSMKPSRVEERMRAEAEAVERDRNADEAASKADGEYRSSPKDLVGDTG